MSASVWTAMLAVSGGVRVRVLGISVASHDPWRALVVACLAAATCLAASRSLGWRAVDWERERARALWPRTAVAAAMGFLALLLVDHGAYVASGADPSGYISQSRLWAAASTLHIAQPLSRDAPWPGSEWTLSPLGYRPATTPGSIVPTYPAGLPILMAAARMLVGEVGVYWVVPILGALAVWLTFRLSAAMAGGALEGVAAAWLLVLSPTFLRHVTQPMSDVPATACWLMALAFAWSAGVTGAVAAGLASSAALLMRPNLVPVALGVAAVVAVARPSWGDVRRRMLGYFCGIAPGVCAVALLNWYLYGSPVASGYGSLEYLFSWDNVTSNVVSYSRWLVDSETPLLVLALLAPLVAGGTWRLQTQNPKYLCAAAIGFAAINVTVYLPYFHFQDWWYLRFLLPAIAVGNAAMCASVGTFAGRFGVWVRRGALAALVVVVGMTDVKRGQDLDVFGPHRMTPRFLTAAEYVQRSTPERAVIVCMEHSGSIRYYTGRTILRYDLMPPDWLDRAIAHLQDKGHPVWFLLDDSELELFTGRFMGRSRFGSLLWKPAAVLRGAGVVLVFAAADASP